MAAEDQLTDDAAVLLASLGALYRRIRQTKVLGDLTLPESSALSHLRRGPRTSAELAKLEHITPQSMGTTVAALEAKGLIQRAPDPTDGRRQLLSLTPVGADDVNARRSQRYQQLNLALEQFTSTQRAQLMATLPLLDQLAQFMPDADTDTHTDTVPTA